MTIMFLWFLAVAGDAPSLQSIEPEFLITDTKPEHKDVSLNYPYDALIHKDRLYVADEHALILVFSPDKILARHGKRGGGPKEFRHAPIDIELVDGHIAATEMYRRARLFFKPDGAFMKKEKLVRTNIYLEGTTIGRLPFTEATDMEHRYFHQEWDCPLARFDRDSSTEYHLAQAIFRTWKQDLFVVMKQGIIKRYGPHCQLKEELNVPVEIYKRKLELDKLSEFINKNSKLKRPKYYRFGVPIIDVAIQDGQRLWLLVNDEAHENEKKRPQRTFLFRVDMTEKRVDVSLELPEPVQRIRVSEGRLILIATGAATIRAYKLEDLEKLVQ